METNAAAARQLRSEEQGARQTQNTPEDMNEDSALTRLKSADVTPETLADLARWGIAANSRKVMLDVVLHPRTPRHVSIPMLRRLFTFDLVKVTMTPAVVAEVKRAAEDQILVRLESLPAGQKITLSGRGPGRVAAELLQQSDSRIIGRALENSKLTEALIITALMRQGAPALLFRLVSRHAKWSLRREVQIALLRSEKTPRDRAREFARNFPEELLRDILPVSRRD
jgi:hypothetical protein